MISSRITDEAVRSLDLAAGRAELLEDIVTTSTHERLIRAPGPRRRPPRAVVVAAVAATVATIVAVPVWLSRDDDTAIEPTPAPADVIGDGAWLTSPGWSFVGRDDYGQAGDPGEVFELDWRQGEAAQTAPRFTVEVAPVELRDEMIREARAGQHQEGEPVEVWGELVPTFSHSPSDHTAILPVRGDVSMYATGKGVSRAEFVDLLGRLELITEDEYHARLPEEIVTEEELRQAIDGMLVGVPTADSFDPENVDIGGDGRRSAIGVVVAEEVACGWIDQYRTAQQNDDPVAEQEAVDAMATSRNWDLLRKEAQTGAPVLIWEIADDMAAGKPVSAFLEHPARECRDGNGFG